MPLGSVTLAFSCNDAVKKVAPDGTITKVGSGFKYPRSVAIEAGNVYVTSSFLSGTALFKVAPSGKITNIFIGYILNGVAVDATGTVYFDDGGNDYNAGYLAKLTPGGPIQVAGAYIAL